MPYNVLANIESSFSNKYWCSHFDLSNYRFKPTLFESVFTVKWILTYGNSSDAPTTGFYKTAL